MKRGLFTADEEAGERGGFVNQYFDSEFTVGVKGDELFNKQKKYFKRMWDVIGLVDLVIITLSKLVNWTLALYFYCGTLLTAQNGAGQRKVNWKGISPLEADKSTIFHPTIDY